LFAVVANSLILGNRELAVRSFSLSAWEKRETASHAGNRPEKGVRSVVELTLRARNSALEVKATEARERRGAELEAMIETRGAG
jgi:hypothetical protein